MVHDELMLDGNARLNLATFVTTWAEPHADRLMAESFDKNMIDKDEYPRTADVEQRCIRMLAQLWNAPDPVTAVGCSTTGSSEACMLAGLALKRRWQHAGTSHPSSRRAATTCAGSSRGCGGRKVRGAGRKRPPSRTVPGRPPATTAASSRDGGVMRTPST